jgi:pyridoxal phosphate enzyme (YggS family)
MTTTEATGLAPVLERLRAAEAGAGRAEGSVRLVAVSKVQPEARVRAVLDAGHRLFGENRVQEAQGRWEPLREAYEDVSLHLVGPLQTNKARVAAALFDAIHTVDREKLAATLARLAQERGASPDVFVQVNTGEEPQKAGVPPDEADALVARCRALDLPVRGLMCIPPAEQEPTLHFALLARIAERNGLDGLSMGMSGDFERAVAQGATHVRIGSSVFGEREE